MAVIAEQGLVDSLVGSAFGGHDVEVEYDEVFDDGHDSTDFAFDPFEALLIDRLLEYWDLNDRTLRDYLGEEGVIDDATRVSHVASLLAGEFEEPDSDLVPAIFAYPLKDSQGRVALIAFSSTGYRFSGISDTFLGVYLDESSIRRHLKEEGYVMNEEELNSEIKKRGESLLSYWSHE
jgi:hypothetical protein